MTRGGWIEATSTWLLGSSSMLPLLAAAIVALYLFALRAFLSRPRQRNTAPRARDSTMRAVPTWASRRGRLSFLAAVAVVATTVWLTAAMLAPDFDRFLASREWHAQPAYLFAHAATVRIFASLLAQNHLAGAAHLDIEMAVVNARVRYLLTTVMPLGALALATPFIVMDLRYFLSADYSKLSESMTPTVADWLMFAIWCLEWLLNAMVWVMLTGFVWLNVHALSRNPFRSSIQTVLTQRLYRPFLRMSAQGASVVFAFGLATAVYIHYAGGSLSDYLGLAITIVLLPACFVPPWLVVRKKVNDLVLAEMARLQASLTAPEHAMSSLQRTEDPRSQLERDMADTVAMLRLLHLERLHDSIGRREAAAVVVRLVAPAATIGWQLWQNGGQILGRTLTLLRGLG